MEEDDTPEEQARAAVLARHAFAHEVGCYGVADGVDRLPLDPRYVGYPEYVRGHAEGMAMPASDEARAAGRA